MPHVQVHAALFDRESLKRKLINYETIARSKILARELAKKFRSFYAVFMQCCDTFSCGSDLYEESSPSQRSLSMETEKTGAAVSIARERYTATNDCRLFDDHKQIVICF